MYRQHPLKIDVQTGLLIQLWTPEPERRKAKKFARKKAAGYSGRQRERLIRFRIINPHVEDVRWPTDAEAAELEKADLGPFYMVHHWGNL